MKKDLQQLFNQFIFEAEYAQGARPKTLKGYRHTFALFCKLLPHATPGDLSPTAISQFFKILQERKRIVGKGIEKTGITKSTIATYSFKLSSFFRWLETNGHIDENPFKKIRIPTPCYEDKKYLAKEAVEKIFTAIYTHSKSSFLLKRNLVIFYILLLCGLRRDELLLLQVRDIDFERKVLTIRAASSKSQTTRHIPMHSTVIMYVKDYLKARRKYTTHYLIASSTRDDKFTIEGLEHLITTLKKQLGVFFHPHQFRHTFAVNFLLSSNNLVKLQHLLGHKSIITTAIYLRCLPPEKMMGDVEKISIDNLI